MQQRSISLVSSDMNGSVEAGRAVQNNIVCTAIVKKNVDVPKVLQTIILEFVGVFQKYNQLDHAFHDITGILDIEAQQFQCSTGWDGSVHYTLSEGAKDTIVFVDDVLCYNPYHIWSSDDGIDEYATEKVFELTSPRGDGTLTVGEIIDFTLKCELKHRPNTLWFGGPDLNHIYFEHFEIADYPGAWGIDFPQTQYTKVWSVFWGS